MKNLRKKVMRKWDINLKFSNFIKITKNKSQ